MQQNSVPGYNKTRDWVKESHQQSSPPWPCLHTSYPRESRSLPTAISLRLRIVFIRLSLQTGSSSLRATLLWHQTVLQYQVSLHENPSATKHKMETQYSGPGRGEELHGRWNSSGVHRLIQSRSPVTGIYQWALLYHNIHYLVRNLNREHKHWSITARWILALKLERAFCC